VFEARTRPIRRDHPHPVHLRCPAVLAQRSWPLHGSELLSSEVEADLRRGEGARDAVEHLAQRPFRPGDQLEQARGGVDGRRSRSSGAGRGVSAHLPGEQGMLFPSSCSDQGCPAFHMRRAAVLLDVVSRASASIFILADDRPPGRSRAASREKGHQLVAPQDLAAPPRRRADARRRPRRCRGPTAFGDLSADRAGSPPRWDRMVGLGKFPSRLQYNSSPGARGREETRTYDPAGTVPGVAHQTRSGRGVIPATRPRSGCTE